ncbi:unnamed protein product [Microthlaspi erraticum]|uniref:Uncharacterized protein n=1 Tax=Microthlaspi erraticum TaxID=1685480 RepID=A0A6D2KGR3_9BRAS|nr:unnamed protein product [Microthlaspi erraticum]
MDQLDEQTNRALIEFAVGIVKKESVINGKSIVAGDVLIGLPSSGSLLLKDELPGGSYTLGEALMAHTVIYVNQVFGFISKVGNSRSSSEYLEKMRMEIMLCIALER